MKFAVVGAGFCGLALSYYLSKKNLYDITLIDQVGIAAGASGIAAGLLHPYVGFKGRLNWRGHEALQETKHLLALTGQNCPSGILRIPRSDEQWRLFQEGAALYDDMDLYEVNHPGILQREGVLIHSGLTVNCQSYLHELWNLAKNQGCTLKKQTIKSLQELHEFDAVVICNGPLAMQLLGLRLKLIKGQLLKFQWPENWPPLLQSVVSCKYVVMEGNDACWVGGTYEHHFDHGNPDESIAREEILSDLQRFMPKLVESPILDCQAGIRVFAPDRRPLMQQVDPKTWVFTGMGSKGLLYHALMAKEFVDGHLISG